MSTLKGRKQIECYEKKLRDWRPNLDIDNSKTLCKLRPARCERTRYKENEKSMVRGGDSFVKRP